MARRKKRNCTCSMCGRGGFENPGQVLAHQIKAHNKPAPGSRKAKAIRARAANGPREPDLKGLPSERRKRTRVQSAMVSAEVLNAMLDAAPVSVLLEAIQRKYEAQA